LTRGQGIAVLTAPAGSGKTLVARRVVAELENAYHTVFLGNSHFESPSSLLQSILHQLAESYLQMTEQELRLAVKTAITSLPREKEALVLVIDEAHLLEDRMLEELRVLTDLTRDAIPLVRLLLSGQLELEETLSTPTAAAFSQRVRCQIVLSPLRRLDAATYVIQQFERSGAEPTQILTDAALELICHASDGSPRCLNQLCDHCLNLAFAAEQLVISAEIVREAVDELKQLPLRWNELPVALDSMPETQSTREQNILESEDDMPQAVASDNNAQIEMSPSGSADS
ncbi:MAG: AAA family ATPase, partial [Planctomycetaceae bacterium]